jgi:hypothetical protein
MSPSCRARRIVLSSCFALGLGGLGLGACATDLDAEPGSGDEAPLGSPTVVDVAARGGEAETADELVPLAAVERENGNLIELYEPSPGRFFFTETGAGLALPAEFDSVSALFLAAAPEAELPAPVVDAQNRLDAMAVVSPPASKSGAPAPIVVDDAGSGAGPGPRAVCGSFSCYGSSGTDTSWCKPSWSNGFYWSWTSVNKVYHKVCSKSGTFTVKLLIDSVPTVTKTLSTGQSTTMGYIAEPGLFWSNDFNFYTEIGSAQGDTFATTGFAIDL